MFMFSCMLVEFFVCLFLASTVFSVIARNFKDYTCTENPSAGRMFFSVSFILKDQKSQCANKRVTHVLIQPSKVFAYAFVLE